MTHTNTIPISAKLAGRVPAAVLNALCQMRTSEDEFESFALWPETLGEVPIQMICHVTNDGETYTRITGVTPVDCTVYACEDGILRLEGEKWNI